MDTGWLYLNKLEGGVATGGVGTTTTGGDVGCPWITGDEEITLEAALAGCAAKRELIKNCTATIMAIIININTKKIMTNVNVDI